VAQVVRRELALEAIPGLLPLRHPGDVGIQEQDVDGTSAVPPVRAKFPNRHEAGGVEPAELKLGAEVDLPDRSHLALRLGLVACGEHDPGAGPGECEGRLIAEAAWSIRSR
jgi:hypothetical protein